MLRFVALRLLTAIPTVFLVTVVAFLMVHAAPGGPFDAERVLPPETAQNLAAAYRLDDSLPRQLGRYLGGLLRGDFGPSYRYRDYDVVELIGAALPVSLKLGAIAILVAVALGLAGGTLAALRRDSLIDRLVTGFSLLGISLPVFVVAPLLVMLFAIGLGWLPASWSGGSGISRYILPVTAMALPQVAGIARLARGGMIEALGSDFARAARAQGLSRFTLMRHHVLRPALIPVVSHLGPAIAILLTGAVVVESVFGIPGLGQLFLRAGLNRDYTLVLGIVIFYAVLIILLNVAVDILYGVLDPRIRRQ